MYGDRREVARLQSDFYREGYYKMLRLLIVSVVLLLGLVGAIIYCVFTQPPAAYFASTTTGQIIPMTPVKSPGE
jgi:hypothetical protein